MLEQHDISLYAKREALLHPQFGGNKWHKLKYNLEQAIREEHDTLLTFGGVWSNHIHATAAAGKLFGFRTIGMIRGDEAVRNANLDFARDCGMRLCFIDHQAYRNNNTQAFIDSLHRLW